MKINPANLDKLLIPFDIWLFWWIMISNFSSRYLGFAILYEIL